MPRTIEMNPTVASPTPLAPENAYCLYLRLGQLRFIHCPAMIAAGCYICHVMPLHSKL